MRSAKSSGQSSAEENGNRVATIRNEAVEIRDIHRAILAAVDRSNCIHIAKREVIAAMTERGIDVSKDEYDAAWDDLRRGRMIGQGRTMALLTPRGIAVHRRAAGTERKCEGARDGNAASDH